MMAPDDDPSYTYLVSRKTKNSTPNNNPLLSTVRMIDELIKEAYNFLTASVLYWIKWN